MSCNTNDRPIDIPPSILLSMPSETLIEENGIKGETSQKMLAGDAVEVIHPSTKTDQRLLSSEDKGNESTKNANEETHPQFSITMPSSHVVEISQTFYWPLYSKPINWIYQHTENKKEMQDRCRRVAELLHSLEFTQSLDFEEEVAVTNTESRIMAEEESNGGGIVASSPSGDVITRIMEELEEEKEDWFNDLSGGQRSAILISAYCRNTISFVFCFASIIDSPFS